MSDIPDTLVLKRHRDLEGIGRSGIWWRRGVIAAIAALAILGAARRLRPAAVHGHRRRGRGQALPLRADRGPRRRLHGGALPHHREARPAERAARARSRLGRGHEHQHDRAVAARAGAATTAGSSSRSDTSRAGKSYILFMQFQVNPTNVAWNRPQNVDLLDGPRVDRPHRPLDQGLPVAHGSRPSRDLRLRLHGAAHARDREARARQPAAVRPDPPDHPRRRPPAGADAGRLLADGRRARRRHDRRPPGRPLVAHVPLPAHAADRSRASR